MDFVYFDKDGYKRPIDFFENFEACPKCNTLNLITTDGIDECFLCGSGKDKFEQLAMEIYVKNIEKRRAEEARERIGKNPHCKVCGKIHS